MSNALYPIKVKGLTFTVMKTPEWASIVQKAPSGDSVNISQFQNPLWHFTLVYDYLYDTYYSPQNTQAYAPYTDLQYLLGFFLARRGQADDFLFFDDSDNTASGVRSGVWQASHNYVVGTVIIDYFGHAQMVTIAGTSGSLIPLFSAIGGTTVDGSVTWKDQGYYPLGYPFAPAPLPLLTDTAGNYYSPIQRSVGGQFSEDVTDLVPGTLQVYQAGTPVSPGAYSVQGPGLALPGASFAGLFLKWNAAPASSITATFQFYFRTRFEGDTQDFERWAGGLWTIGGESAKNGTGYIKLVTYRPPNV